MPLFTHYCNFFLKKESGYYGKQYLLHILSHYFLFCSSESIAIAFRIVFHSNLIFFGEKISNNAFSIFLTSDANAYFTD
jgi:hypothetical protein